MFSLFKTEIALNKTFLIQFYTRCFQVVNERKSYEDAKAFCSSQTVKYQGVVTHAQLMDLRSSVYTRILNGK